MLLVAFLNCSIVFLFAESNSETDTCHKHVLCTIILEMSETDSMAVDVNDNASRPVVISQAHSTVSFVVFVFV